MTLPAESELAALYVEAVKRSGSEATLSYPVPRAGLTVVLCRLSKVDYIDAIDAMCRGGAEAVTARNVAISKARLWPEQREVASACEAVPGLAKALWDQIERLHGANTDHLEIVTVRDSLDDGAVAALGIDPARLRALRKQWPHEDTLRIATYQDPGLGVFWSAVLKLPGNTAADLISKGLAERGHETMVTFAINSMVEPRAEQAVALVRGEDALGPCLFSTLYGWAQTAAAARPTILRPRSMRSATSTVPQTSSERSSSTLELNGATPPAQAASSSPASP